MTHSAHIIGGMNNKNGMCGFAASVYMAAAKDPSRMPTAAQGSLIIRTIVEIGYFLQDLKSRNRKLFDEIQAFTRTCGEIYKNFDLDDFILLCNRAPNFTESNVMSFDVGMTPDAVAAYLEYAWDIEATTERVLYSSNTSRNCILGLCEKSKSAKYGQMYGGLAHWVYRHNGRIYSYGRSYDSIAAFNQAEGTRYYIGWVVG